LIHAEAGVYQACFDGTPYRPNELDRGILAAPDVESWRALREVLFGG
jgi:hypothetical protein